MSRITLFPSLQRLRAFASSVSDYSRSLWLSTLIWLFLIRLRDARLGCMVCTTSFRRISISVQLSLNQLPYTNSCWLVRDACRCGWAIRCTYKSLAFSIKRLTRCRHSCVSVWRLQTFSQKSSMLWFYRMFSISYSTYPSLCRLISRLFKKSVIELCMKSSS